MSLATLKRSLSNHETLSNLGTITEFLPQYGELTYRFNEGLSARISEHGNGKFQVSLGGFYHLEPTTIDRLIDYLSNID